MSSAIPMVARDSLIGQEELPGVLGICRFRAIIMPQLCKTYMALTFVVIFLVWVGSLPAFVPSFLFRGSFAVFEFGIKYNRSVVQTTVRRCSVESK